MLTGEERNPAFVHNTRTAFAELLKIVPVKPE
jgi:hypothetical protein